MARILAPLFTACVCTLVAACATMPGSAKKAASSEEHSEPGGQSSDEGDLDPTYPLTTQIDSSIPERFRKNIELAQIEGRYLFREDRAAWVATDSAIEQGILERHREHATGWLSEQLDVAGDQWNVVFTGNHEGKSFAVADVSVEFTDGKPKISVRENEPPRELTAVESVLILGRDKVKAWNWLRCADIYNTSAQIFIDEGKKYVVVRVMPAQMVDKILPMGGFHRYRIPMFADGHIEHFSQTKTCLDTDTTKLETGETFGMTLLTSPTPTEFDVFTSLSYGRPHYVHTKDGAWLVDSGKIQWLSDSTEKNP